MKSKLEDFTVEEITTSVKTIGRKRTAILYGVSDNSMARYCTKHSIRVKDLLVKHVNYGQKDHSINDASLEDLSFKHYLIGLISSDGHLNNSNIHIYQKNASFLKSIKKKLGSKSEDHLYVNNEKMFTAVIHSKLLQDECRKYMKSDKRYTVLPYECENGFDTDYIRGLFDGDGCIYYMYKSGTLTSASMTICTASPYMKEYLISYFTSKDILINISEQVSVNKYWVIGPGRADEVVKFINELYKDDGSFRLDTKYIRSMKYLKLREIDKIVT